MARFNEILVGRFNRGLQKIFGMKGRPPVATLSPEIQPSITVPDGVESRWVHGWNKFGVGLNLAAVAGQGLGVQLRLLPSLNALAVIESCIVSCNASNIINASVDTGALTAALTSIGSPINLDGRYGNNFKGAVEFSFQSTTPSDLGLIGAYFFPGALGPIELINHEDAEIPMVNGPSGLSTTLRLKSTTANVAMSVGIRWRERFLEEGERL